MIKNQEFEALYQKIKRIGEGSFGKVYLYRSIQNRAGTDKENQKQDSNIVKSTLSLKQSSNGEMPRFYAMKKLKIPSNNFQLESLREIQNLKHFKHKNLMQISGIINRDKGYKNNTYLVMDYGFEVLEFAKHKQIKIQNAILRQIIKQIVQGVKAMHEENYIHRDLKPDNIFVFPDGNIKIGDFSISRKADLQNEMTGNITTRHYRPPEIIFGKKNYSKEVDIWSLGCTLAELVLHQPIFPGQTDINQLECIFKVVGYPQKKWKKAYQLPYYFEFEEGDEKVVLDDLLPNIQPQLLDLLKKLLSLDPEQRPNINQIYEHEYIKETKTDLSQLAKISLYIYEKKLKQHIMSMEK